MPSTKDPNSSVDSTPGKLSTGVVPSSALLFPSGGGSGAALQAHINNPKDAHMAGAIGIPPVDPTTGDPLLASAGGPIDGESVLDFIDQFAALLPTKPNVIGLSTAPNSGVPNWGTINSQRFAGFTRAGALQPTAYDLAAAVSNFVLSGIVYPADRGVLALYTNNDGTFGSSGSSTTTLAACLWLGANPPPAGMPSANFVAADRSTFQSNYVAAGSGLDLINLAHRYPVLNSYASAPYSGFYANYPQTFPSFQIATYTVNAQALAAGDAGSFLLVQWHESFATSISAITPTSGTPLTSLLTTANCYSTVPGANYDTGSGATINRRNVFVDAASATAPSGNSWTSAPVGSPSTTTLSGIAMYNSGSIQFNVTMDANHLFTNSYETSTSGGDLPAGYSGFTSTNPPVSIQFNQFGGGLLQVPFSQLRKHGTLTNYSNTSPPAIGDIGEYNNTALSVLSPSAFTQAGGISFLQANLYSPFAGPIVFTDSTQYLFNSRGTASTTTADVFVDEHYRCSVAGFTATNPSQPIVPSGASAFNSSAQITTAGNDLQVIGDQLVYPHYDFTAAAVRPVQAASPSANYAAVLSGDASGTLRRYIRMFDTGISRGAGHITIVGLPQTAFYTGGTYTGSEVNDHPGGCIVQLQIPGQTGWMDLGQPLGNGPSLGLPNNFGGILASYPPANNGGGSFTWAYTTTGFNTAPNGSGNFLIIVRVTLIKNGTGQGLALNSITWSA